jgi:hypothetical protein
VLFVVTAPLAIKFPFIVNGLATVTGTSLFTLRAADATPIVS